MHFLCGFPILDTEGGGVLFISWHGLWNALYNYVFSLAILGFLLSLLNESIVCSLFCPIHFFPLLLLFPSSSSSWFYELEALFTLSLSLSLIRQAPFPFHIYVYSLLFFLLVLESILLIQSTISLTCNWLTIILQNLA